MKNIEQVVQLSIEVIGKEKVQSMTFNDELIRKMKSENNPLAKESIQALLALKYRFVEEVEEELLNRIYSDTLYEEKNLFTDPKDWKAYLYEFNGMEVYDFFEDTNTDTHIKKEYFATVARLVYEQIINEEFETPDSWNESCEGKL